VKPLISRLPVCQTLPVEEEKILEMQQAPYSTSGQRDEQSCQGESGCGVYQSDNSGRDSEGDLAEELHSVEEVEANL